MADPVSTAATGGGKTGAMLLAIFGASSNALLGEWSMVLVGALIGAALHVSVTPAAEMPRWWHPLIRYCMSVLAAVALTRLAAPWLVHVTGGPAVESEYLLLGASTLIALGWRATLVAVLTTGPAWLSRRLGGGSGEGKQ